MRLSKQSGYAVRIVLECAESPDALLRIAGIAKRNRITKHNIGKTVPLLVRHKIVEAVRGRGGGIRLARPPERISIGEIVRVTEHSHVAPEDFGGNAGDDGPVRSAPFSRILDDALKAFISVLEQHTVADFMATRGKARRVFPPGSNGNDDEGEHAPGGGKESLLDLVLQRPGRENR